MIIVKLENAEVFTTSKSTDPVILTKAVSVSDVTRAGRTRVETYPSIEGEEVTTYWIPNDTLKKFTPEVLDNVETTTDEATEAPTEETTEEVTTSKPEEAKQDNKATEEFYVVQRGDSLESIAKSNYMSIAELVALNTTDSYASYTFSICIGKRIRIK